MYKMFLRLLIFAIIVPLLLVACALNPVPPIVSPISTPQTAISKSPIPTQAPVAAGKGGIIGILQSQAGGSLPKDEKVFLAKFVWNAAKTHGVYVLDPANATLVVVHPTGWFQFKDLEPGDYALLVGVAPEKAVPIPDDRGQARVIEVVADQIVDLGKQRINLP